jgi:peptidoglycan/LPS O-acetylase OafA/YrhL
LRQIGNRFTVLDSWRGVCAIIVVVYHFMAKSHLLLLPFFRNGWIFVDFFFALSGFVITHAYSRHLGTIREFAAFAVRRFGRVWPLHMAVVVAFLFTESLKLFFDRQRLQRRPRSVQRRNVDRGIGREHISRSVYGSIELRKLERAELEYQR